MSDERRLHEQLLDYWKKAKGERVVPAMGDVNPADIPEIIPDCFMVKTTNIDGKHQYRGVYMGANISKMFGGEVTESAKTLLGIKLVPLYNRVVDEKKPLIEESEFINVQGEMVKYRQILLPLGPDDDKIDHIFGGVRWKKFEKGSFEEK